MRMANNQVGSNQYKKIPGIQNMSPTLDVNVINEDSHKRRCGQVWGTECTEIVSAPSWGHADHPTPTDKKATAANTDDSEILAMLAGTNDSWEVRQEVAHNTHASGETLVVCRKFTINGHPRQNREKSAIYTCLRPHARSGVISPLEILQPQSGIQCN